MNCPLVESAKHLAGVWMWLRSLEMELTLSVTHPDLVSSCLIGLICGSPCQPVLDSPPTGKLALIILLPLPGWPRGAPCSLLLLLPRPLGHAVTRTPFRDDSSLCCPGGSSPLQTLVLLAVTSPGAWPGLVAVTAGEPLQSRLCPAHAGCLHGGRPQGTQAVTVPGCQVPRTCPPPSCSLQAESQRQLPCLLPGWSGPPGPV